MTAYTTSALRVGDTQRTLVVDFRAPNLINFTTDRISVQVASSSSTYLLVYALTIAANTNATQGFALATSNISLGI